MRTVLIHQSLLNRRLRALSLAGLAGAVFVALALLPPIDYRFFAAATRAWRSGASQLYDAQAVQFFYAPWSLILLVPLSLLPDRIGQALFNLISLGGLCWGVWVLARPGSFRALALALATPFTAALLLLGQWDGLIVGGVGLGWYAIAQRRPWLLGIALLLISTKPTNTVLVVPVLLYAVRHWPRSAFAKLLAGPVLAVGGSFLACGWDWPRRYLEYVRATPPLGYDVSLWRLTGAGLPIVLMIGAVGWLVWAVRRAGVTGDGLSIVLVISLLISPFVVPYHYVATAPALAAIARRDWRVGVALWVGAAVAFLAFALGWSALPLVLYLLSVVGCSILLHERMAV
jgi:Glycosyltransferase family 87